MNDNATPLELLIQNAEDYSKTTLQLVQLMAIGKWADILSALITRLVIIISAGLAILIITIGLALWIGKLLGDSFYGFYIVGAFYATVTFILYLFKNSWIKNPIQNSIISQLMKEKTA